MKNNTCQAVVDGMHCESCELYVSHVLSKQKGISQVKANAHSHTVSFALEEGIALDDVKTIVNAEMKDSGYEMKHLEEHTRHKSVKRYVFPFIVALILSSILYALQQLNVAKFFNAVELSYGAIFFLGVVASLTTCMAVVGGLALSLSSSLAREHKTKAIVIFHIARIVGFIVLGGVTALFGKTIILSGGIALGVKLIVAISMIIIGLDMLDIHLPRLTMPKVIAEKLGIFEDKEGITQAFILGVSTYFLPCAFTQSMQINALSSGSFVNGALIMGAFVFGTTPVLALVSGGSATVISYLRTKSVTYTMGFVVLLFALFITYEVLRLLWLMNVG